MNPEAAGTIVTFYSYKGGVGRTMAVANVGRLLPRLTGKRKVLLIDWDLDAPGLHHYFEYAPNRAGVIEYFRALFEAVRPEAGQTIDGARRLQEVVPLEPYIAPDVAPGVDLMRAGKMGQDYARLVTTMDWAALYGRCPGVFAAFRNLLMERYPYVLIDSRTGLTDISGICTILMPEKLVAMFALNRQSIDGISDVVTEAVHRRQASDDLRPLAVFPLPSRVVEEETPLKRSWLFESQRKFEVLFRQLYGLEDCDLRWYFDEVRLPHAAYYSFGERVAVVLEKEGRLPSPLRRAYKDFAEILVKKAHAWQQHNEEPS